MSAYKLYITMVHEADPSSTSLPFDSGPAEPTDTMSSRKHEQLSQDTKNRRARIADVTALIHFALFVVSIFAIEIIGCVYGSSYSRVSTILGPILWDVCVVTLLILFLIRYKWDHTANREAVLTRVLCFVEVAVIYVTLGLLITFVTP